VIEKGVLIDYDVNHKGRGYDSAVIVAPIDIMGERHFCYVTITRKNNTNRFYLHEVWTEKNLTNVGSNAVQGQPSRLQGFANILQNIVSAKESQDSCIANVDVRKNRG
jgi:hypothetical protein